MPLDIKKIIHMKLNYYVLKSRSLNTLYVVVIIEFGGLCKPYD